MNEKMLVFQVLLLTVVTTLAVKNIDEDHPYEFGFTIDGQQHRHEKKDDKGIIQGEFGFITADGIYHVTVYATDENGDFKILSMKNLRISAPLDGSPFKGEISPEANKYRKQANLPLLPQPNPLSLPGNGVSNTKEEEKFTIQSSVRPEIAATTEKVNKFTTQSTIRPACASCGLISTPKPQPVQPFVYQNTANGQIAPNTNVNQSTVDKENGQQPIGSGGPSITNLPPAYQAVSGPQSTNYNTFGSQELNKQPEIGNLQNPLVNLGVGAPNTQSDNNGPAGGHISNTGVGVNEYKGNEQEGPGSQLGNTDGQYSNVGGDPTNSGLGDYSQQGQTPVNVENGQESPSQFGNSGPPGPYTNNASPGGELSNGGLGVNVQEQSPNVQVSNGQSGNGGPANQQGNIQSGPGLGPAGQSDAPEPNPLQLPIGGQGVSPPSTLPPISVSDGFIHVGGDKKQDIPIKDKFPGMEDGLPAGIDEKDITNLLYKFHYTVGFHGHYEKGLKNGAKIGGYFVNGRDGISRIVTYIADENGYRPKVKFINLGLESDDTPKPETEKTFGLKSFEFVWYPL